MTPPSLSREDLDLAHELINIAFGRAVADLQQLIDIFVVLRPPEADLFNTEAVTRLLREHVKEFGDSALIEQVFYGDFSGKGLLVLPGNAGQVLLNMLDPEAEGNAPSRVLEDEAMLEIGNILIGACIGQLSELLATHATYAPPRVVRLANADLGSHGELLTPDSFSLVLRTSFQFESRDLEGYLLILSDSSTFTWLRTALEGALERLF